MRVNFKTKLCVVLVAIPKKLSRISNPYIPRKAHGNQVGTDGLGDGGTIPGVPFQKFVGGRLGKADGNPRQGKKFPVRNPRDVLEGRNPTESSDGRGACGGSSGECYPAGGWGLERKTKKGGFFGAKCHVQERG